MSFQDQDQPLSRMQIGKIVDAHGLKGLVKILIFGCEADLITPELPIYTDETGSDALSITLKNPNGKYYLAAIDGVTDRNQSEALKGCALFAPRESLPESDELDLIGFAVVDEQGKEIGAVTSFDNFGASDLIEVQPKAGKPFYIPIADQFVVEINEDAQSITVQNYKDLIFE